MARRFFSKLLLLILAFMAFSGCVVRQEDLNAWRGAPVVALEKHPIFITLPVIKTKTSDGTEIWNYVNGANVGSCFGSGALNAYGPGFSGYGYVNSATYSQFSNCISRFAACNNIFYIKDGYVESYNPIGTGGIRCYTTKELQPHFRGIANIR